MTEHTTYSRRLDVEAEHARRNRESLDFLAWLRQTGIAVLRAQLAFAVGWQRVALERELRKRNG